MQNVPAASSPSQLSAAPRSLRAPRTTPLGAASYDADVEGRTLRALEEMLDAMPELEAHEETVAALLRRALNEQDRASRADEVLRRFSPSVRMYIEHFAQHEG